MHDELHGLDHSLVIIKVGVRSTRLSHFLHLFSQEYPLHQDFPTQDPLLQIDTG